MLNRSILQTSSLPSLSFGSNRRFCSPMLIRSIIFSCLHFWFLATFRKGPTNSHSTMYNVPRICSAWRQCDYWHLLMLSASLTLWPGATVSLILATSCMVGAWESRFMRTSFCSFIFSKLLNLVTVVLHKWRRDCKVRFVICRRHSEYALLAPRFSFFVEMSDGTGSTKTWLS